jgi:hypothetical protein
MARRATLRASDADREKAADRLRQATAEGRLLAEELEQRLEVALSARTYSELDALVSDLPGSRSPVRWESRELGWLRPTLALTLAVPVALAVIATVLAVIGGLAIWWIWLAAGWWFFGHRRRRAYRGRYVRSLHPCSGWQPHRGRAHASRGFWA